MSTARPRQSRRTKVAAATLPPTPLEQPAATSAPLLSIRVEGKPISVNSMYGNTRTGRKYLTPAAKAWQGLVWAASYAACVGVRGMHSPRILAPDGAYRVVCTFYRIRANADADNLLKLTIDGLKTGIKVDDKYFIDVNARKSSDRTQPQGALIEVYTAA